MRPLELLLPIVLVIYLLWPLTGRARPRAVAVLPAFGLVILVTHWHVEGARWQMIPFYVLTPIIFLISLSAFLKAGRGTSARPQGWALAGLIFSLLLLAVSTALPALLPVPQAPAPTGPYTVGTATFVLTDNSRKELYSDQDEPRKFMLEVWYPAVPPGPDAKPAPWMPDAALVAPAIADYIHLPHFFLDHLALAKDSAYENLPTNPNGGPYPVLVFSHGWNGFRQQSTFLMQELASHGYIVAALEHPYGSVMTVFPDGTSAPNNPSALPKGAPQAEYELAAQKLVNQWAEDIGYALDFLAQLNENDPNGRFTSRLALDKTGVFGHSTGGGATIQFCGTDARCQAGLTLDAFVRPVSPAVLDNGVKQPFFFLFSELWPFPRNTEIFERFYSHVAPTNHVATILGADHYDFSDLPALTPLATQMGLKGPINGARVQQIITTYTLAFFDKVFKGQPTTLLDGPVPDYPEVRFEH